MKANNISKISLKGSVSELQEIVLKANPDEKYSREIAQDLVEIQRVLSKELGIQFKSRKPEVKELQKLISIEYLYKSKVYIYVIKAEEKKLKKPKEILLMSRCKDLGYDYELYKGLLNLSNTDIEGRWGVTYTELLEELELMLVYTKEKKFETEFADYADEKGLGESVKEDTKRQINVDKFLKQWCGYTLVLGDKVYEFGRYDKEEVEEIKMYQM